MEQARPEHEVIAEHVEAIAREMRGDPLARDERRVECHQHLRELAARYESEGMEPVEAARRAVREFGSARSAAGDRAVEWVPAGVTRLATAWRVLLSMALPLVLLAAEDRVSQHWRGMGGRYVLMAASLSATAFAAACTWHLLRRWPLWARAAVALLGAAIPQWWRIDMEQAGRMDGRFGHVYTLATGLVCVGVSLIAMPLLERTRPPRTPRGPRAWAGSWTLAAALALLSSPSWTQGGLRAVRELVGAGQWTGWLMGYGITGASAALWTAAAGVLGYHASFLCANASPLARGMAVGGLSASLAAAGAGVACLLAETSNSGDAIVAHAAMLGALAGALAFCRALGEPRREPQPVPEVA